MVRRFKNITNRGSLIRFALVYGGGQTSRRATSALGRRTKFRRR